MLLRRADARKVEASKRRNVSTNSLWWLIYVINLVEKTKLPNFRLVLTPYEIKGSQ